jgi:ATP-dependent Clp protease ATP-binding subunit ClpA
MAIVRGLAQRVQEGEVPLGLGIRRIVVLDLDRISSRYRERGVLETLGLALTEAKNSSTLVCIPEIGGLPVEAFALLAASIGGDGSRVIGSTTPAGYEHISVNAASFADHCHPVLTEEPTLAETIDILRAASPELETHHGFAVQDAVLIASAESAAAHLTDKLLPRSALDLLDESASLARSRDRAVSVDDVHEACSRWTAIQPAQAQVDVTEKLQQTFAPAIVEALTSAPLASLLVFIRRGSRARQFMTTLAAVLFGTPAALVEVDLSQAPGRLVTYAPGKVWFPHDPEIADALRKRPRCVVHLSRADTATPAGLHFAEHVLTTPWVTDPLGRRLDLSQAVILLSAAHGSTIDPALQRLVDAELELTRDWSLRAN